MEYTTLNRRALLLSLGALGATALPALASSLRILSAEVIATSGGTQIFLEFNHRVTYRSFLLAAPNRLVLDVKNIPIEHISAVLAGKQGKNNPFISNIRFGIKDAQTVRIVFDLKQALPVRVSMLEPSGGKNYRINISIPANPKTTQTAPVQAAKHSSQPASSKPTSPSKEKQNEKPAHGRNIGKKRKPVVVLDPGHGGRDPGASTEYGLKEKDIVLSTALETKKYLEAAGCTVHLTRSNDVLVSLVKRRRIARSVGADLFISIHADTANSPTVRGSDVYIWGEANSEHVRKLVQTENKADLVDGLSDIGNEELDTILSDMMQIQTTNDSRRLGNLILNSLGQRFKLHNRQVSQANFAVLRSLDIPSVLIELGFLTNKEDIKLLSNAQSRKQMSSAIANGVRRYLANMIPSIR